MARKQVTATKRRVQVETPTNTGGLDVVAPMDVSVAPASQGWAQLQNALLGTAAPLLKEKKQKDDAEALAQGVADQRLNKVDQERVNRQEKYADGVFNAKVTTEAASALREIDERAAKELPFDATVEEAAAWFDAQAQTELGPLAADPKARRAIHEMYADALERFTGRKTVENREQNRQEVISAMEVQVARAVEGGDIDAQLIINDAAGVLGRTEAAALYGEMIAQRAEAENDESILSLLPDKVITEDGQTIDSPFRSLRNKARIELARERIKKHKYEVEAPAREWDNAQFIFGIEDRITQGLPIEDLLQEGVTSRGFTDTQVNAFRNKALAEKAKVDKKRSDEAEKRAALKSVGGRSWLDTYGVKGGVSSMKEAQYYTDLSYEQALIGLGQKTGKQVPLNGKALADPANARELEEIMRVGAHFRLPSTALKSYLSEFNPAMGETVLERLPLYASVKAHGQASWYMTPESEAQMELALTAQRAGQKPEQIMATLQRAADPAQRKFVQENREKAQKLVMNQEREVLNAWRDADTKALGNVGMVKTRLSELTDLYATYDIPPQKAAEMANRRFNETHYAVKVDGVVYALPESTEYDSAAAAVAVESFSKLAQMAATEAGDPSPSNATMKVEFGVNGRGITAYYAGSDGLPINDERFNMQELIDVALARDPSGYRRDVEANREAQNLRRYQYRRLEDKAFGRDISIQPKM
jgi:hypothetical protein